MSTEKAPAKGSNLFPANDTANRTPSAPTERKRGITASYRSGDGLFGYTPSYHKEADTLWQDWDKAMADPNNPARKTYEAKRREGQERDNRIHAKPVSKLEADKLKAERAKAEAQSHLIPKGPGAAYVRSSIESERERRIHHLDKRLGRQQGNATRCFNPASKAQIRGPMRGPER